MAGLGISSYGGSAYGVSSGGAFDVLSVWAETSQTLRVAFSSAPRTIGDRTVADALTRSSYTLSVSSTRGGLTPPAPPRILAVRVVDTSPHASPLQLELLLAGELAGSAVTYHLSLAGTTQNAAGALIGVRAGTCLGLDTERTLRGGLAEAERRAAPSARDLAQRVIEGGFRVVGGDLDLSDGPETIRKLVLRRLLFPRGGIVWRPGHGWNPGWHALQRPGEQAERREEARRQILREPEVSTVDLALRTYPGRGMTIIEADCRLQDGRTLGPVQVAVVQGGA